MRVFTLYAQLKSRSQALIKLEQVKVDQVGKRVRQTREEETKRQRLTQTIDMRTYVHTMRPQLAYWFWQDGEVRCSAVSR
jgi:hypothetical protein